MTVHGSSLAGKIQHVHPAPAASPAPAAQSSAAASFGSGPAATLELSSKAKLAGGAVTGKDQDGGAK